MFVLTALLLTTATLGKKVRCTHTEEVGLAPMWSGSCQVDRNTAKRVEKDWKRFNCGNCVRGYRTESYWLGTSTKCCSESDDDCECLAGVEEREYVCVNSCEKNKKWIGDGNCDTGCQDCPSYTTDGLFDGGDCEDPTPEPSTTTTKAPTRRPTKKPTLKTTYTCYHYSQQEKNAIRSRGEKAVCESAGNIFTRGRNQNYQGCGTCWCCRPHQGEPTFTCNEMSGDGVGGSERQIARNVQSLQACMLLVVKADPSANGATWGRYNKKCYKENRMTGKKNNNNYKTCFIKADHAESAVGGTKAGECSAEEVSAGCVTFQTTSAFCYCPTPGISGKAADSVAVVSPPDEAPISYLVNGFALLGFGALVYGAGAHYCKKRRAAVNVVEEI